MKYVVPVARACFAASLCLLVACKPPPSDEALTRVTPEAAPTFASDPLPSPDTEGATWVDSGRANSDDGERIVYGIPGEAALLALECVRDGTQPPMLRITRFAQADEGAGAMMALIGNGHMGRLPVDAEDVSGRLAWEGMHRASEDFWEPLAGPRSLAATVPGAGRVSINPSPLPGELIDACRKPLSVDAPDP
ncbi:MAG: hypothetical protein WA936_12315 [Erythrobacter sp.]|uniref:hypothetical protein n=1 Tax=Erythrobacter sp. TaxID=1042 RepID=UPI003C71AC4C